MKKLIKPLDLVLIAALLLAGGGLWLTRSRAQAGVTAVVLVGGEEVRRIDLTKVEAPYEIELNTIPAVTLTVEPGAVSVSKAACRDKLCVKAGRLTKVNDSAVCLPARVTVRLIGKTDPGGVDAAVY